MSRYTGKPVLSQPVKWYYLIDQVEYINKRTHLGMPILWGYIHDEEYELACEYLRAMKVRQGEFHPWMADLEDLS